MIMGWSLPLGILIGVAGTRTAFQAHHVMKARTRGEGWWLLLAVAWLPSVCWTLAQFVAQY